MEYRSIYLSNRDVKFTSIFWQTFQDTLGTRFNLSTAYHAQTDGKSERTIQTLEDMLRAYILEWGGSWVKHLPLVEFAYNNSYHASIGMPPFEALYGRPCRTPLCWTEVGETQELDPEIIRDTEKQVEMLQQRLKEAHDRQKSYADNRRKELEFAVGDMVYLKMRNFQGGKQGKGQKKLRPRYMGPYSIIRKVGAVAYKLALPQELSEFHDVFHVSVLRKVVKKPELIISSPPSDLQKNYSVQSKPEKILERREKEVNGKKIVIVKVAWKSNDLQEETWEAENDMKRDFPELFEDSRVAPDSRTNPFLVGENCNNPDSREEIVPRSEQQPSRKETVPDFEQQPPDFEQQTQDRTPFKYQARGTLHTPTHSDSTPSSKQRTHEHPATFLTPSEPSSGQPESTPLRKPVRERFHPESHSIQSQPLPPVTDRPTVLSPPPEPPVNHREPPSLISGRIEPHISREGGTRDRPNPAKSPSPRTPTPSRRRSAAPPSAIAGVSSHGEPLSSACETQVE